MIYCYNFYMIGVGDRLKELRIEHGLTQKELADKIGQAQSAITYWEKNEQEPVISSFKKLCDFFDVSADYLLGRKDY